MKFYYCVERELKPDTFSSLIMKVIGAPYSHAFILVDDIPLTERIIFNLPKNAPVIFEATIPKYSFKSLSTINPKHSEIVESVEIKVRNELLALGWLMGNMGKDYSIYQSIGFLEPKLKLNLVDIWGNGEGQGVCSEFCARFGAITTVRPDVFHGLDLDFIDPKQGLELFKKLHELTF